MTDASKPEVPSPRPWTALLLFRQACPLLRRGLRRDRLEPGTEIIVDGYQAKDHSLKRANGRDVAFADGSKIFQGSSGTGAPYEEELLKARREKGRC